MGLDDLMRFLTGDLEPGERKVMQHAGLRILWRIGMTLFVAFSMGWLAFIGLSGFVRAGELEQKIAPVNASIAQLASAVKALSDSQREQTLALLRVAITDGLVKRCHADKDETKQIYRNEVNEAQVRYFGLTGAYYPEHSCADL